MKSLINKVLVFVIIASIALSLFTCVTFAAPEDNAQSGGQALTGNSQEVQSGEIVLPEAMAFDSTVRSDFDYDNYLQSVTDTTRPEASITLSAKDAVQFDGDTGKILGSLPLVKKAPLNNPSDEREGALFYDEGICGWVVNVKQSGWYNITLSYLLYEDVTYEKNGVMNTANDKSSAAQRRVYIDYKVPFYEARQVNFARVWKDQSLLRVDTQTFNEKRPYQVQTEQWETASVRDYMGYEGEAFRFYLEAGTHTIAFEAVKEGMIIEYGLIHQIAAAPTYAELKAEYNANGYKHVQGADNVLFIQAEGLHNPGTVDTKLNAYTSKQFSTFLTGKSSVFVNQYNSYISADDKTGVYDATKDPTYYILKSSPTLYAISDRSSPSTVPYHHAKIRYNTIGADKWQSPNDWIQWTVNVDEAGLYAISFKARQNTLSGMHTTRKLTINGVQPCQEVGTLTFQYSNSFKMYTPATYKTNEKGEYVLDKQGNKIVDEYMYFYLNKGENTIRLETTLGQLGDLLAKAERSLSQLNYAYRRILMITGPSPDLNANYMLNTMVPDAIKILKDEYNNLVALEQEFIAIYDTGANRGISAQLSSLKSMILLLERMNENHNQVATLFTNYKDAIAAMGTWINDMSQNPLELDYFVVASKDYIEGTEMPKADANFFAKALHELRAFIASFTEDYDNIGGTVSMDGQEPVVVWLETGAGLTGSRDNATILKQLIDDMFTADTGIIVSTRLVAGGSLLPSVLAGIGPEICLARTAENAINYAFRGAVMNLANEELFPDYKEVLLNTERYAASAVAPFTFGNGIYAVPETQDFFMTFYRTDILEEIGLDSPETWNDVYNIIGHLQNQQMTFAMPVPIVGAVGSGNLSFAMLLYQKGGQYYTEDRSSTDLTSDAALDAFKEWTEFYTLYNLPNTYDFANRFRTGEVPVGIASYSQYSQLAVFAPEIQGLWEFSLVPGTIKTDENGNALYDENGNKIVDHSCASSTAGCVMLSMDSTTEEGRNRIARAWEFMKWWTGEDAQYRFGTEIESLLGAAARYTTANLKAMARLPWDKKSMNMIQEQWKYSKAVPQVPGGYYTARNIEFAWKEVINNAAADPNTTFVEYVGKIDREIDRKRDEFKDKIAQMTGKAVE